LDAVYVGAINYMLEQGFWRFAQRTVKIDYDTSVTPAFGYLRAYLRPSDFVRLYKLCQDEFLLVDLLEYTEEGGHWYGNDDEVYLSYISNHASYGGDLTLWPESFTLYAGYYLATRIVDRLAPPADVGKTGNNNLSLEMKRALDDALTKDAMKGPVQFAPAGNWVSSRARGQRRLGKLGDGGNSGNLIG
jgi:hypothetical protein